jgi:hypothetical protein
MPISASTDAPISHALAVPSARTAPPAAEEGILAGCAMTGPGREGNHSDSDDTHTFWTATATHGDCSYEMKSEGRITFNRDVTGIDGIAANGFVDITATIHGAVTALSVRPDAGGPGAQTMTTPVFAFSRDGHSLPFVPEGAAWLAKFLVTLDRQTAFAIDTRLPALLAAGGPARVLEEIPAMFSDHTRGDYLKQLIRKDPLASRELQLEYVRLSGTLNTEHDRADALVALAQRAFPFEDQVRDAYLQAANTLQARHERDRVLAAIGRSGR